MVQVKCPECDADLNIPDDFLPGEVIHCTDCGLEFEIDINDKGEVELRPAEVKGEDWGE